MTDIWLTLMAPIMLIDEQQLAAWYIILIVIAAPLPLLVLINEMLWALMTYLWADEPLGPGDPRYAVTKSSLT